MMSSEHTSCSLRLKAKGVPWRITLDRRVCCLEEVPADRKKNDDMLKCMVESDEDETGSSH